MNAPMYPDADQSAASTPITSATLASPEWLTMFSIGSRSVSTADDEPRSSAIRSRPSIESWEPRTPSSETSTISPGKIDSTE